MNNDNLITTLCNLGYHAWSTRQVIDEDGFATRNSILRCEHCETGIPEGGKLKKDVDGKYHVIEKDLFKDRED